MHCGAAQSTAIVRGVPGRVPPPPQQNFEMVSCLMHFQPKVSDVYYYISE